MEDSVVLEVLKVDLEAPEEDLVALKVDLADPEEDREVRAKDPEVSSVDLAVDSIPKVAVRKSGIDVSFY